MAFDAFLKLDQIDGEVVDKTFDRHIEVVAFDWSLERPETDSTRATRLAIGDLVVQAPVGKQTPQIVERLNKDTLIASGELTLTRLDPKAGENVKYVLYKMTNCLVSSYRLQDGGDPTTEHMETFTLRWTKLELTHPESKTSTIIDRQKA